MHDGAAFGPQTPIGQEIHAEKYRSPGESFREAMNRVAAALQDNHHHYHEFREILLAQRFLPGGRVQTAMGSGKHVTAFNCFVSGIIADSFVTGEGCIMDVAKDAAATMRMGGGIGYDFSTLRPRGALIKKLQSSSSGPLAFMGIFDAVCQCVKSSGHRRGAQMGVLRVDHPDVMEFLDAKTNENRLTGFNISLAITDEFMEALVAGRPFFLCHGDEVYREVDPTEVWEKIMRTTWDWAEPGVLYIDAINRANNLRYCEVISATNPCVTGETLVLTREGHVAIEELVGRDVEVWNGEEWSMTRPFSTGENALVEVELSDGSRLRCTPGHLFVLRDGSRRAASELESGDYLERCDFPVVEAGLDPPGDAYSQGFYSGDGSSNQVKSFVYEPKWACAERLRGTVGEVLASGKARLWYHGHMLAKDYVPLDASLGYCLDWLAGLVDADGCAVRSNGPGSSVAVQVGSVDRDFLSRVSLMLRRMGTRGAFGLSKLATSCGNFGTPTQDFYSLSISPWDLHELKVLGFSTERLRLGDKVPQRQAARHPRVSRVTPLVGMAETFCFTEPLRSRGVFNGILTGQCGEQPLPPHGACLLGSFNLVSYLRRAGEQWTFDWDQFAEDIPSVVRAMDNVVDRTRYPLVQQQIEAKAKRRMGLGVTALANAAEAQGMPYGSAAFLAFEARVLDRLAMESYRASALLAKEKGAFPAYHERYLEERGTFFDVYFRHLTADDETVALVKNHGLRNSHLTSIAPTGTISLTADNVSSAIEPVFLHEYERMVNMPEGPRRELVQDYGVRVLGVRGKTCDEVTIDEHLGVLIAAQRRVDSAVSKTCNVPASTPWEDFKSIYLRAWECGAKGCTTFNTGGKRAGILVAKQPEPEQACRIDAETGRRECA